jgi:hypothetical protein
MYCDGNGVASWNTACHDGWRDSTRMRPPDMHILQSSPTSRHRALLVYASSHRMASSFHSRCTESRHHHSLNRVTPHHRTRSRRNLSSRRIKIAPLTGVSSLPKHVDTSLSRRPSHTTNYTFILHYFAAPQPSSRSFRPSNRAIICIAPQSSSRLLESCHTFVSPHQSAPSPSYCRTGQRHHLRLTLSNRAVFFPAATESAPHTIVTSLQVLVASKTRTITCVSSRPNHVVIFLSYKVMSPTCISLIKPQPPLNLSSHRLMSHRNISPVASNITAHCVSVHEIATAFVSHPPNRVVTFYLTASNRTTTFVSSLQSAFYKHVLSLHQTAGHNSRLISTEPRRRFIPLAAPKPRLHLRLA